MQHSTNAAALWCLATALSSPLAAQERTVPSPVDGPVVFAHRTVAPTVTITPILGTEKTLQPSTLIADLDDSDRVAGRTWWEFAPGVVYVESFLGFLWGAETGMRVFVIPLDLYFSQVLTIPRAIADDLAVVGGLTVTTTLESFPFLWTPQAGFETLAIPAGWAGDAVSVSSGASKIGGTLRSSLVAPPQAARWSDGALEILGLAGTTSYVVDGSEDGSVLVGDVGPDAASVQATRWIDGVEVALPPVPGGTTSSALHVSDDGTVVVGRAVADGREVLVRWAADGSVEVSVPPDGLLLERVNAINPDGTAAAGALSDSHVWGQGNWVPFLWRSGEGFTLIGELGHPDEYDLSQAFDLSDDGTSVVGDLSSFVFGPGSEPPRAFLWTADAGTRDLAALQQSAGGPALGIYSSTAISGDGRRMLATGTFSLSPADTNSVILEFDGL